MKKKLCLFVAIMVVVLAACLLLVGCAPNDGGSNGDETSKGNETVVYKTPQELLNNFYIQKSNTIVYSMTTAGTTINSTIAMYENTFVVKNNDVVSTYYEYINNSLVKYRIRNDEVTTSTFTKEQLAEQIGEVSSDKYLNNIFVKFILIYDMDSQLQTYLDAVKNTNNFELKDGWYVGKVDTSAKSFSYKITEGQLEIKFTMDESTSVSFTLKNGAEKITIPENIKNSNN